MPRYFPRLTANSVQATAYLLGVAFFSISFLVFLNASISFVVTDVVGQKEGVGDAVGSLGFADELLALVACPLWGLLSDRLGVRTVVVTGYIIIGISLICLVQARNVYPQLLIARLCFSVGGAACSTMVTAILPAMTVPRGETGTNARQTSANDDTATQTTERPNRYSSAPSVSSELTITPDRYTSRSRSPLSPVSHRRPVFGMLEPVPEYAKDSPSSTSQLAGWVGMSTGLGALLAVGVFLPLPSTIGKNDSVPRAEAVKDSFYIVGSIAIFVGFLVFFGLRGLPGEEGKGPAKLFNATPTSLAKEDGSEAPPAASYFYLVQSSIRLGFTDSHIGLGYVGGFVARASSVGISLFIPLFVHAYFIRNGACTGDPSEDIKLDCRRAYTLASMLTGVSQLVALLSAPLFGYLNGYLAHRGLLANIPLALGGVAGVAGCVAFGMLDNPDPFSDDRGGAWAIVAVILLGIGQIGAIVCSLGLLARGVQGTTARVGHGAEEAEQAEPTLSNGTLDAAETAPLLPPSEATSPGPGFGVSDRTHLKGTIAGVYSLGGGAGILLLTKLGGYLFDKTSPGAPFYMLAIFNAILLVAVAGVSLRQYLNTRKQRHEGCDDGAEDS